MRNGKRVLVCMLVAAMAVGTAGAGGEWRVWENTKVVAQAAKADENGFVIKDGVLSSYIGDGGDVVIPDEVTRIENNVFGSCKNLTSVKIPGSVKDIEDFAFSGCESLKDVNISEGVSSIGRQAFYWCGSLTNIVIPSSVENIGSGAFAGCHKLTQIQVDSNNQNYTSVDGILFSKDGKELLQYPNGRASVKLQDITTYTIPDDVTVIGEWALGYCNFTNIMIPNSVTTIRNRAFFTCDNISSITIPASVTSIEGVPFEGCDDLTEILVNKSNPNYASVDGVLFSKDKRTLIEFPGRKNLVYGTGIQEYSIPFGVTKISANAFEFCHRLTKVKLPEGLTSIGKGAFESCAGLREITLPWSLTSIGEYAFAFCRSLSEIILPKSVMSIGDHAFQDVNENFTIYCVKDSYAHTYAVEHNYRYGFVKRVAIQQGNLKLKKSKMQLKEGQKSQIKITSKLNTKATYQSLNASIATVSKKGAVIGKKKGKTTIVVSANGKKKKVKVTVKADPSVVVLGKGLKLSKKSITVKKGKKITIKREPGVTGKVTFKALDEKTVRVTAKGVVKAKKRGRTSVVVKLGKNTAKLRVTVKR